MSIKSLKRNIKYWFQRRTRCWSDDETWNLDWEFFKWVNSRFKQYIKDAGSVVDLEFYKFNYKGEEYTQLELINKVIELTNKLADEDYFISKFEGDEEIEKAKDEVFDIFKLISFSMWW